MPDKPAAVDTLQISEDLLVDRDEDGTVYGIELLNARQQLRTGTLSFVEVENEESGERTRVEVPF